MFVEKYYFMPVNLLYYVFSWQAARNKVPKIQLKIDSFLSCLLCVARFISLVRCLSYDWVIHRSVLGGFTKNKQKTFLLKRSGIRTGHDWKKNGAWKSLHEYCSGPIKKITRRCGWKQNLKNWGVTQDFCTRMNNNYLLIVFLGKSVSTWPIMIKGTKPSYQEHVLAYKTLVWCGFSKCPSQYCVIGPTLVIIHLR